MLDVNTYDTINLLEDLEKEKVSARQAFESGASTSSAILPFIFPTFTWFLYLSLWAYLEK